MTMKKFMTNIKTLAAMLIAGAAMTACSSSDDNIANEQPVNPATQKYIMTVNASKGDGATTRALTLDGSTLNASWATTENVYVKKGTDWVIGSLQPQTAGATANLTGELSGTVIAAGDGLTLQFPKKSAITFEGQTGTIADIEANYDYATANVTVASVANGQISVDGTTTFQNHQAIIKFTLLDKADGTTKLNPSAFTITDGTNTVELTSIPEATYTANGAGVLYVAFPATGNEKIINLTATVGSDTYTYTTSSAKKFTNGKYYAITVKMTKQASAPEGAISGKFSVSSTKKVYFSKGNLQATTTDLGSTWTWAFAENQWDYIGGRSSYGSETQTGNNFINGNGTVSANGTVDLFGWSTSATTYGMNNSTNSSTYSGNFVDWGATMGTGWFTLSSDEWTYLFNNRSASTVGGTDNGRYAKGWVNSVRGVILFPDTYTHPDGVTAPTGVNATDNTGLSGNDYRSADWTKMEAAGCVFLPAAGDRYGWSVNNAGSQGYYWSSSPYGAMFAFAVYFSSGSLKPADDSGRCNGYSVRLVREVE